MIDARGKLVIPGLINAHYHSHDTLCRGLFEELPLEMWLLYTLPLGANRSKEELRARTLVGALESIRCGITCVQDMLGLIPLDDANDRRRDRRLPRDRAARRVLADGLGHAADRHGARQGRAFRPTCRRCSAPPAARSSDQLDYLEHQFNRHPAGGTLHWALAPFAPQRCTPKMLQGCADLAHKHDLPVYTHVYETRGQALIAREQFADHGGSLISYLENNGLLGPQAQHRAQRLDHARRRWTGWRRPTPASCSTTSPT